MVCNMSFLYKWKTLFTKIFIDVSVKEVKVKSELKRLLRGAGIDFRENVKVKGSVEWIVDVEIPGHDIVIVCCEEEGKVWEEYVKCQDITQKTGKTCILVMSGPWMTIEMMQLATMYGVIIVDHKSMDKIPSTILGEAWSINETPKIRGRTPKRVIEECRREILGMLRGMPLTRREIIEALSGKYPRGAVGWCISKLKADGSIEVLGRTAGRGEAVYIAKNVGGLKEALKRYMPSKTWAKEIKMMRVLEVLKQSDGWRSTKQIAETTGMSIQQVIATLKSLSGRGLVIREKHRRGTLWKIRG